MTTFRGIDDRVTSGDLIAELAARAPATGANTGHWPGLTIYRFTAPTGPTWEEIQSLSLCIVAQGRKAVTVEGRTWRYDPFNYLVLASHLTFQAEILEASPSKPFLSFVLQIDPAVVRRVSTDMLERNATTFRRPDANAPEQQAFVSGLDRQLLGAVLRFLHATGSGADRRILAPIYLQEMVYRVLQREQFSRLMTLAATQTASNPLTAALAYVQNNLSQPLTVADMAEQVSLSPSAFAHLFRDVTGKSPYHFVKELRLDRARELLVDGEMPVATVSKQVGYSSASHFISEFRRRFGVTPRAYGDMQSLRNRLTAQSGDWEAAYGSSS
jgi:AraC-like DNA-binding protein